MIAGIFLVVAAAFMIYFIFSDSSIQPIDTVERDALGSLIGVYDEQILHMEIDTEGKAVFSLFDRIEETGGGYSLHIATIENPKIVLNEMVLIGNCLYVNIIMNEQGEPMYTYKINLMSRAVEPIRKVESYDTFVPIAAYGEEIAILECKTLDGVHGESIISNDPKKNIALMVDEWGTWWDVEPGTIPGHLFQQNTMRDAFVAALTLHVFHKYTDRVKMTNIAQIVNVLQSMILTKGKDMVLTPTYHVFEMYKVHQDATFLPMDLICDKEKVRDNREVPVVSASASRDSQGKIHISLANVDPRQSENIHIDLQNVTIKSVNGRILTASSINDYNTFDSPEKVKPEVFKGAKVEKGKLSVSLPPMSIVVLEVL